MYYGSNNSVSVYDPGQYRLVTSLNGHVARVNCIRCVATCQEDDNSSELIVSGASDHGVRVWRQQSSRQFTLLASFTPHSGAVTNVSALPLDNGQLMVASTSTDNSIKVSLIR